MQTDDFLADLGAQLRDARPRRDLRPLGGVAVLVLLAVAAFALVPRGEERARPAAPATSADPRVAVLNGTTIPDYATRTVASLRRAGYRVLGPLNSPDRALPITTVDATAPRFAKAAAALRRRLGAEHGTRTGIATSAAVASRADIVVVLGADGALPPLAATVPRVRVVNQSGSVDWGEQIAARLRARGVTVTEVTGAGTAFRTRVVPLGPDRGTAAEAAADIGVPDAVSTRGANPDGGPANVAIFLGADLPGATLLESKLPGASCVATAPAGAYSCDAGTRRYDVSVKSDGSFVARRRGPGADIRGTGARP